MTRRDRAMNADGHDRGGYQKGGRAWDPQRADVVRLLTTARHQHLQPIYYGSNHCFLLTLDVAGVGRSLSVYKPASGEYPLYDFPSGTLYRREAGSWIIDCLLGWHLVPPTVVTDGKHGVGSLQLFIESRRDGEVRVPDLRRLALLDTILNNADRKLDHCLAGTDGKLWGIDHGLTFHAQNKLRTVLWHFAGSRIPAEECTDLERLAAALESAKGDLVCHLRELIAAGEWRALLARLQRLIDSQHFPDPRYKPVPYRW